MPYLEIGREITRGTICRDRWRADVVVACSDEIPPGGSAPLAVRIRWRSQGDEGSAPRPDDAAPIVLRLRKTAEASSGDLRFDGPDGPTERAFTRDAEALLRLFGVSATAGAEPDVLLEVSIEGEVRGSAPLAVRAPERGLRIRSAHGGGLPPDLIPPGWPLALRATAVPPAEGAIRWLTLGGDALRVEGPFTEPEVTVVGRAGGQGDRAVCALHSIENGTSVLAAHRLGIREGALLQASPGPLLPVGATIVAAGWSRGQSATGAEVEMIALIEGGMTGQRVTFVVGGVTGPGVSVELERFDVPLGEAALLRIPYRVPSAFPGEQVRALGFTVELGDEPTRSASRPEAGELPELYGEMQVTSPIEITLTDSAGVPLAGVAYELQRHGVAVAGGSGVSGGNGEITIPDLPGEEYILVLRDTLVLDASEPEPAPTFASPENTIFSFVDVRLGAAAEAEP